MNLQFLRDLHSVPVLFNASAGKGSEPLVKCQRPEVILLRPRKFTCSLFKKETDMCTCPFIFPRAEITNCLDVSLI